MTDETHNKSENLEKTTSAEMPDDQELEMFVPVMILPLSWARHYLAMIMLAAMGFLFLSIVVKTPPAAPLGIVFLIAVGALALYVSYLVWQVSGRSLHLTADELCDDQGQVLCLVKDIKTVERGALAFKPSGGFVVVLKTRVARGWAPGLWWKFGKRIGVGGVVSSGAGKAMADVLAARVQTLAHEEQDQKTA
jgi:hypothetical protein